MAAPTSFSIVQNTWTVEVENGFSFRVSASIVADLVWEMFPVQGPMGPTGPIGPTGPPGTGDQLARTAVGTVNGHRAVVSVDATGVSHADPSNPAHLPVLLGIALGAALTGEAVTVTTRGPVTEPSWTWTPGGPIYVGPSGILTQSVPLTGWLRIIGWAQSATTMMVEKREPIVL